MASYLVTATVTYEVHDVNNTAEAVDIFVQAVTADPSMDGVTLAGVREATATTLPDDDDISDDAEWEEANPFTRATEG